MNVQQIMEDVIPKQHVQIQLEVLVVNVIMDILGMDFIVMVSIFFPFYFFLFFLFLYDLKISTSSLFQKIKR